jgi:hypothetical protein
MRGTDLSVLNSGLACACGRKAIPTPVMDEKSHGIHQGLYHCQRASDDDTPREQVAHTKSNAEVNGSKASGFLNSACHVRSPVNWRKIRNNTCFDLMRLLSILDSDFL